MNNTINDTKIIKSIDAVVRSLTSKLKDTTPTTNPLLWRTWCNVFAVYIRMTRTSEDYELVSQSLRWALDFSYVYQSDLDTVIDNVFKDDLIYNDLRDAAQTGDDILFNFYKDKYVEVASGKSLIGGIKAEHNLDYIDMCFDIAGKVGGIGGVLLIAVCSTLAVYDKTKDSKVKDRFTKYPSLRVLTTYAYFCGEVAGAYTHLESVYDLRYLKTKYSNTLLSCLRDCSGKDYKDILQLYAFVSRPKEVIANDLLDEFLNKGE